MLKRKYKQGYSLIEVLISTIVFGIIVFSSYFIIIRLYDMKKQNEILYNETLFLQNCYEIFNTDPVNFRKNLSLGYKGDWIDNTYYKDEVTGYEIIYHINQEEYIIEIQKEGEVKEKWVRKKVIPSS